MTSLSSLPPFPALRGFEAAARLNSFRLAAEELHLSPSAVSHHVRQLEEFIGQSLFERGPRGVTLTRTGQEYLCKVTEILNDLAHATDKARKKTKLRTILLRCSPGCSSRWLMPQLNFIRDALGAVNINITTQSAGPQADAEIRCGYTYPPDAEHEILLTTYRAPVCSKEYLQSHGPIRQPSDLENCTLLQESQHDGWDDWFAKAAPENDISRTSVWFDDGYAAMAASELGMGVFLGHLSLLAPELSSNRLVQLFDETGSKAVVYTLRMKHGWQRDSHLVNLRNSLTALSHPSTQAAE